MPILCPIHPTPLPSGITLVREGQIGREGKRGEKKRGRDDVKASRRKKVLSSNYYPPEPICIPNHKDQPPTMVNDLIPAPENSREVQ